MCPTMLVTSHDRRASHEIDSCKHNRVLSGNLKGNRREMFNYLYCRVISQGGPRYYPTRADVLRGRMVKYESWY
jgi:hypothetical protein